MVLESFMVRLLVRVARPCGPSLFNMGKLYLISERSRRSTAFRLNENARNYRASLNKPLLVRLRTIGFGE